MEETDKKDENVPVPEKKEDQSKPSPQDGGLNPIPAQEEPQINYPALIKVLETQVRDLQAKLEEKDASLALYLKDASQPQADEEQGYETLLEEAVAMYT